MRTANMTWLFHFAKRACPTKHLRKQMEAICANQTWGKPVYGRSSSKFIEPTTGTGVLGCSVSESNWRGSLLQSLELFLFQDGLFSLPHFWPFFLLVMPFQCNVS